ncbi:helix-turn-helix transcriptional regulator [Cohnella fermenti]|uniref:YafY family transcriptional regulator n=1 Tax=Cohnella fermenti TaxID=2565925 RepID=A0A4S4BH11_9BACL|nr:YafY family protein [Cohnella fermenti]THF73552.1 YafY family transcriptional regulator [Cohnella fermenti]
MPKSKRLLELMMTVNRKRRFKVQELADEFGVSKRTILRDLQELSELGVPLYSEPGPHGGYQVVRERVLPPIAFTEGEAVSIFFAVDALRHYVSLPFESESSSALDKFYRHLPGDVRDRIDAMKNRVDIVTPRRRREAPCLAVLLNAAIDGRVLRIEYESAEAAAEAAVGGAIEGATEGKRGSKAKPGVRSIQPIGIYASNGLWYCPAYCFLREGVRVFRCDRIRSAEPDPAGTPPIDLEGRHLGNRKQYEPGHPSSGEGDGAAGKLRASLTPEGVRRCEPEPWLTEALSVLPDGGGMLEGRVPANDIGFYARFFAGLGREAAVLEPAELREAVRRELERALAHYS